jgi:glyoxylase-like metal-dependent hydrolase (beta-lactamase superfamily II)
MAYPIVHRHMGKFMVLPRDHVNAFVVEGERSSVIVDATLALSSARELRQKAESLGKPIEAVLLTHGHPDHYTGLAIFEDLPRYGSQGGLEFAHREDIAKAAVAKGYLGDDYPDKRVFPNEIVKDGAKVKLAGVDFTFHDLGPGESDSDGMWSFTQGGIQHSFVGDAVSKNTHNFFRDLHAYEWLKLLDRLQKDLPDTAQLYFGHGNTPSGTEVIGWTHGYVTAFLHAVRRLKDHPDPASRPAQEQLIEDMKDYLPSEATLFLLDYELGETIPHFLHHASKK